MKKSWYAMALLLLLISCGNFEKEKLSADTISNSIEELVDQIQKDVINTANESLELLQNPDKYSSGLFPESEYEFYNEIMYHNPIDKNNGKFLYSGYFPVGAREKEKVQVLEHFIPFLKSLVNDSMFSGFINQSYLITYDTLFVLHPYSDLISFIPPERNIQDRGSWKMMNVDNNPDKDLIWTSPYVDTTGKGFMVSLMYPVYNGAFMEALVGVDITIPTLKEMFFDNINEKMLLIDINSAQIMAISDSAVELMGIENIEAFKYLEMIDNSEIPTQSMPDNLVLSKTDSPFMQELWRKIRETEEFSIIIDEKIHKVYRKIIGGPQWFLVIVE